MKADKLNNQAFATLIKDKFIEQITISDISKPIVGEEPENLALVGMLKAAKNVDDTDNPYATPDNYNLKKKSISSVSMTFVIDTKVTNKIIFEPVGHFYKREVLPYSDELERCISLFNSQQKTNFNSIKEIKTYITKAGLTISDIKFPATVYKAVPLTDLCPSLTIDINNDTSDSINKKIEQNINNFLDFHDDLIAYVEPRKRSSDLDNLFDEATYSTYLNQYIMHANPNWNFEIRIKKTTLSASQIRVKITLINSSVVFDDWSKPYYDTTIYNAGFIIKTKYNAIQDIHLNGFMHDYDDYISVKATVENANLIVERNNENILLRTNHIPVYEEKRILTKDSYNKYITFKNMIDSPIENLRKILRFMEKDLEKHQKKLRTIEQNPDYSIKYKRKFKEDIDLFELEIRRFELGINIIEDRTDVLNAFRYMNESFMNTIIKTQKQYDGWRLFQIVFIVSEIRDIVFSEYKNDPTFQKDSIDIVDLIYFPTGGGKTEAFLGATVFAMFFDRIRGKQEGVTAFIKYPLRLLSVQQLDRILNLIERCNDIRKKHLPNSSVFTSGYFVGKANTPNKIKSNHEILTIDENSINEKYRIIDICPRCGNKSVNVKFERETWTLNHHCSSCGHKLNIHVIDDEIYRYIPTIIVGTIDKLASIAFVADYKLLFGQHNGFCNKHGFYTKNECPICRQTGNKDIYDPIPTLNIQDELHLVRESLGTYTSHYESFIRYYTENLVRKKDRKKIKYIAASATISNFKQYILQLYNKSGRCFPTYIKGENFYSYEVNEDINRYIMGFLMHGRSITENIRLANIKLRELLYEIYRNKDKYLAILKRDYGYIETDSNLTNLIHNYFISIIYNNSKNDSVTLGATFENQGNNYLDKKGIPLYKIEKITGDDDFSYIKRVLFDIHAEKNKFSGTNLILATSSISHGVDEDNFNQITFFGMPNNIAEYIQAYSRVGRKYTGLVFDVIRMVRERDYSYLKNFIVFHKYKDKVIEPVPINKWAINAVYRTLPGIILALAIQYYDNSYVYAFNLKQGIVENKITLDEILTHLFAIYGVDEYSNESLQYKEIIEEEIRKIFTDLPKITIDRQKWASLVISKISKYGYSVMTSLRDVDITLKLEIDR